MTPTWDPALYSRFFANRARPFADLVGRVEARTPRLVLDLGCGDGRATVLLPQRWPGARVVGVDRSEAMLEAAGALPNAAVEWVQRDLTDWSPTEFGRPDVIVSSSTLQWVDGHHDILRQWWRALAPGGWLAVQMPNNYGAASHGLMRMFAARHPDADQLLLALQREPVGAPGDYFDLLAGEGAVVDAWETTYLQVLDPDGVCDNPVFDWVRGTGLRPVLDLLTEPAPLAAFLEPYAAALKTAYPRGRSGVLFPFRRVFVVAHREGS